MIDNELLDLFIQESSEHLETLEPDLLALETSENNTELISRIFRSVHSIKGTSGFVGLTRITKLSHIMEHVMSLMREDILKPTKEIVDSLLAGFDKLRTMIVDVQQCDQISIDGEIARLQEIVEQTENATKEPSHPDSPQENTSSIPDFLKDFEMLGISSLRDAVRVGRKIYIIRAYVHKDVKQFRKALIDMFKEIESVGEFLDSHVDISGIDGLDDALYQDLLCLILCSSVLEADLLSAALKIPIDQISEIDYDTMKQWVGLQNHPSPSVSPQPKTPAIATSVEENTSPSSPLPTKTTLTSSAPPPTLEKSSEKPLVTQETQKAPKQKGDETIRVSVSLLDDLMNLAGEMILGRNQLLHMESLKLEELDGMTKTSVLQNLSIITSDLQEKVMRTRLQPIGSIFNKFHRIVRDLANQLNKEIDLHISGEEVELDKSIIEGLSDPLTHLIRNCVDHAIEMPDNRERVGKSRNGLIQLTASHVGGQVLIQIVDDGRGIDPVKVKNKALEKGLITSKEAEEMGDRQAQNLIFLPGFSTAEKLTDISGRGVGMDVVKTNIEKLSGSVDINSEVGKGTSISLKLPLTLAIIPTLVVEVGQYRFAVPQINLQEIVWLSNEQYVEKIRGSLVFRLRGKYLSLIYLPQLLKMDGFSTKDEDFENPKEFFKKKYILILKADNYHFGVIVDQLLDSEEIVVKPLSQYIKTIKCYSGATIMGDGKVALILDTVGLATLASLESHTSEKGSSDVEQSSQDLSEVQSLLLFRNGEHELFALNLGMVSRIEQIRSTDIQRVGDSEYLQYENTTIQLVRLHRHMAVSQPTQEPALLYIIIPKLVHKPMGIIATKMEDVIETTVSLDEASIQGVGILGSALINKTLTIFLDIYSLFEAVDPMHYKSTALSSTLKNKRILLAEDTAFFRSVEVQYLKQLVGHVDVAKNGLEAWDYLNKEMYDLLLTDIEMPGMNGLELTRKVRESERLHELPVIALTSLSSEEHISNGINAGVDAYETKLDKEHLKETLEHLLLHKNKQPAVEGEQNLVHS